MASTKSKVKIIMPIIIIVIGLTVFHFFKHSKVREGFYSGVAEATTYDLAFEIAGKIEKYYVNEGQKVKKGDLLVKMDQDTLMARLKEAKARLGTAKANLANIKAGPRPQEIQQARAKLRDATAEYTKLQNGPKPQEIQKAKASMNAALERYDLYSNGYRKEDIESAYNQVLGEKSNLENAKKNFIRYKNLYEEDAIAARDYDFQQNQYKVALSRYNSSLENYRKMKKGYRPEEKQAAYQDYLSRKASYENLASGTRQENISRGKANVDYWREQVDLLLEGPRIDDVKAAEKKVKEAEAAVEVVQVSLKNSKIYAPADGVIVSNNFENTEMIAAGVPVISMADLEHPWIYIFIPETEVGKVKLGDKGKITVDSFPGKDFKGEVSRIYEKAEFTPKFIQTQRERVNLVFRAKVAVENKDLIIKPGMPADVEIIKSGK